MTEDKGKWVSRSFSLHSVQHKELLDRLDQAAREKDLSKIVRKAVALFMKYEQEGPHSDLDSVLERLDRIERKLDQGGMSFSSPTPNPDDEDSELAQEVDSLLE